MKYLIISPNALSLFIVPKLNAVSDVETIYFAALDFGVRQTGVGLEELPEYSKLQVISDPFEAINKHGKEDLLVFIDDLGAAEYGEHLRRLGYRVIGGAPLTDKIENDRTFATDLMSRVMDVPETFTFSDFQAGMQFLKTQEKTERFVFKPHDGNVPKEYTYVSKDVGDMIEALTAFKAEWKWETTFQLQRFVKGAEVDFSAYFNGKEFIDNSMMIYFENKPIMNEDIGPAGGGAIAVEFARGPKGIFWEILQKLIPMLKKANYQGQLAVNCIVSEDDHKPYFLEFCGRVGYPSFPMDITILEDSGHNLHELFVAVAAGINRKDLFDTKKAGVVVDVSVPPGPAWKDGLDHLKGLPVSWNPKWDLYFYPYYTMYDDKKKSMVLTGCSAEVLNVTCADVTIDGAVSMLYEVYLKSLKLKNAQYRTDLGKDAKRRIKLLKEWGLFE